MLRVYPFAVLVCVSVLFAAAPAFADEVELNSGAVFRGTIQKETDSEVVIRTDLGDMAFPKSGVKEVRRTTGGTSGDPADAPEPAEARSFSIKGLDPAVRPVLVVDSLYAVRADGHLAAWSIVTGEQTWMSDIGKGEITGLAADPGGVYLLTRKGQAARLHSASGSLVWLAKPGGAFSGAPLLLRRKVYGFQVGTGLVGIESANGSVTGRLSLPVDPDTPLAATARSIVFGTTEGVLMSVTKDGTVLVRALETGHPWGGRPVATRLRSTAIASEEMLITWDADALKKIRTVAVPGLASHPFAIDATRAYVELDGALTALNLVNGRVAWRCFGVPRVLAMAIEDANLFVTTSDDTIAAISQANGSILWSAPLGGRPASPPIPSGRSALVLLEDGRAALYSGTPKAPGRSGPGEVPPGLSGKIHSPDGFRVEVPTGWSVSEGVTRGRVSLGFRPSPEAPRFDLEGATERDRSLLDVSAYLSVVVLPASKLPREELVKIYLHDEKLAARDSNHRVGKTETATKTLGGREWTKVRIQHIVGSDMLKGTFEKVALTTTLSDGRIAWIEGKVPALYRAAGAADADALAASMTPEKLSAFTPSADVAVAESAMAALDRGDMNAFSLHLAEPLRARVAGKTVRANEVRFRLLTRSTSERGSRRVARVRLDRRTGTTFTSVTLAKERGRWVIIDLGGLLT